MLAFAGNSILCRMALRDGSIDPASFTSIRLLSGAVALLLIVRLTSKDASIREHGGWISALMLFFYAICFSYAYISLSAGTGALILFGFVQGTMIAIALWSGDRPSVSEWLGWLLAFGGLVWAPYARHRSATRHRRNTVGARRHWLGRVFDTRPP